MLYFLFLVILSNSLIIPVVRKKNKIRLAPTIPTDVQTTLEEEII